VTSPASGGVMAMCSEILAEYRFAAMDGTFQQWLAAGAPSADAEEEARTDSGGARARRRRSDEPAPGGERDHDRPHAR